MKFEHLRHKPPSILDRERGLVIACAPMKSKVNSSRIVRTAGCLGIKSVILSGNIKVDPSISRDAVNFVEISYVRTLLPALKSKAADGFQLIGLEQTTNSNSILEFKFPRNAVLVIGNERKGIDDEVLALLDRVVEIPVYGQPFSFNAATSASIAMYEYCRQYPLG